MAIFIGLWIAFASMAQIPTPATRANEVKLKEMQDKQKCDTIEINNDQLIENKDNHEEL